MAAFRAYAVWLALALPAPCLAQDLPTPADASDWFVRTRAIVGLSHAPGDFDTLPPGATGSDQTSYQPQEYFGAGVGLGRTFSLGAVPMRAVLDGSLNFRHDTDVDALFPGGSTEYQANLRTWDIRLSLLADILQFGWGRFYVGGGIGAALVETDVDIADSPVSVQNSEWKASPSFEAGIVFDGFSRRIIPEVSYRFRWIGDLESGRFPTGEKLSYENFHVHDLMFGFTIPLQPEPIASSAMPLVAPTPALAASEGFWTGFHIGAFGGWGIADVTAAGLEDAGGTPYNAANSYSLDADGLLAGGEIGLDWQWNWLVLGLAGEAGYLGLDGSAVDPASSGGDTETSFETDWYGAISARGGIAWNRFLVYGRLGVAFLNAEARTVDACTTAPCGAATVDASDDEVLFAMMPGAGVEFAFSDRWSFGAEYRYLRVFDDLWPSGPSSSLGEVAQSVEIDRLHTVRGTINYRW